jgi:methyl coenzyme M reductase alpha subunit
MTAQDEGKQGSIMPNIAEQEADNIVLELISLHVADVKVDEKLFLDLLKHSLSLSTLEKKRVVDAVPTLSQFQFDELAKVFTEEREKFRELSKDHPDDIKKLLKKQQIEWLQLGDLYRTEKLNKAQGNEDQAKMDEIKKNLGL